MLHTVLTTMVIIFLSVLALAMIAVGGYFALVTYRKKIETEDDEYNEYIYPTPIRTQDKSESDKIIHTLKVERECAIRSNGYAGETPCNKDCEKCILLQSTPELIRAYDKSVECLELSKDKWNSIIKELNDITPYYVNNAPYIPSAMVYSTIEKYLGDFL